MANLRSRAPRARTERRKSTWVGPADQGYQAVATGAKVIVAAFDPQASFMLNPTIVRTRGEVSIFLAAGADVSVTGAFGIAVVTDRAFAAGVASLPDSVTDAGWNGWFVWRSFAQVVSFDDATGQRLFAFGFQVDSKAMRKIGAEETMVVIAASQAGAFNIYDGTRHLFLLS